MAENVIPLNRKADELRAISQEAQALRIRAAALGDAPMLAYLLAMAEDEATELARPRSGPQLPLR